MLLETEERRAAASDFELLLTVAKHKAVFFRSGWANYDTARQGTLRLLPSEARIKDLRGGYRAMAPMMFDEAPPAFDDIMAKLGELQAAINAKG